MDKMDHGSRSSSEIFVHYFMHEKAPRLLPGKLYRTFRRLNIARTKGSMRLTVVCNVCLAPRAELQHLSLTTATGDHGSRSSSEILPTTGSNLSSMNSLSCQCRRQTERGDKHRGRNPHAVFTAAYIFLFAESSPSYGRRPVLGPSLFSVSSGRRKLASRILSILSAHGRTDGRTDERTNGRTDGRTNGHREGLQNRPRRLPGQNVVSQTEAGSATENAEPAA